MKLQKKTGIFILLFLLAAFSAGAQVTGSVHGKAAPIPRGRISLP